MGFAFIHRLPIRYNILRSASSCKIIPVRLAWSIIFVGLAFFPAGVSTWEIFVQHLRLLFDVCLKPNIFVQDSSSLFGVCLKTLIFHPRTTNERSCLYPTANLVSRSIRSLADFEMIQVFRNADTQPSIDWWSPPNDTPSELVVPSTSFVRKSPAIEYVWNIEAE